MPQAETNGPARTLPGWAFVRLGAMQLIINGQTRELESLVGTSTVAELVAALAMQADRVALERNGVIIGRAEWAATPVEGGDRFEIVHFVGGGSRNERASGCNSSSTG